jgi:hypothetical protein
VTSLIPQSTLYAIRSPPGDHAGEASTGRGRGGAGGSAVLIVAGTPEQGAVVLRAKELVDFARQQGYRVDELVRIIEDVG